MEQIPSEQEAMQWIAGAQQKQGKQGCNFQIVSRTAQLGYIDVETKIDARRNAVAVIKKLEAGKAIRPPICRLDTAH